MGLWWQEGRESLKALFVMFFFVVVGFLFLFFVPYIVLFFFNGSSGWAWKIDWLI